MVALAEPVVRETLCYGRVARHVASAAAWEGSLRDAVDARARARCSTRACSPAPALWAAGAAVLPWLVRGRSAALDLVAATLWAAGLAAGAGAIGHALGPGTVPQPDPRGVALGAAAGVLIAVAARAIRGATRRGSAPCARIGSAGAPVA